MNPVETPTGIWTASKQALPDLLEYTRPILAEATAEDRATVMVSGVVWTFTAIPRDPRVVIADCLAGNGVVVDDQTPLDENVELWGTPIGYAYDILAALDAAGWNVVRRRNGSLGGEAESVSPPVGLGML